MGKNNNKTQLDIRISKYQIDNENNKVIFYDDQDEEITVMNKNEVIDKAPNFREEYIDINEEEIQFKEERRTLNLSTFDKSLIDLKFMHERDKLELNPSWQRDYVWNRKKASLLIESFLVNIPVPPIYISEKTKGTTKVYEVVDGKQRITSILDFMNNKFKLRGMEIIVGLNNKKYSELDESTKDQLDESVLRVIRINNETDGLTKFDLFKRINTGSVRLSPQEIRYSMFINSNLNKQLKRITENKQFLFYSKYQNKRKRDDELILRQLAFLKDALRVEDNYENSINKYIIRLYETDDLKDTEVDRYLKIIRFLNENEMVLMPFLKSVKLNWERGFQIQPRPSYMDALFFVLANEKLDEIKLLNDQEIKDVYNKQISNEDEFLFSRSSPSKEAMEKRRKIAKNVFNSFKKQ